MAEIKAVTDATFEEAVLKNERPVVVDFWAAWCGPCKMVAPEMEKIAAKYDGQVDVVKVDVDANPGLSRAFNIMSIPTIAFFKPGSQPQGVVGFRPMEQLETQFGLAEFAKAPVTEPQA
jgi:thioredoxin 1